MTDPEIWAVFGIAMLVCLTSWRPGVSVCLLVGFLQDPFRKLTPNEPVYFTAMVGIALGITLVGAKMQGVEISFRPLHAWNKVLRMPLRVFAAMVLLQSVAGFVRTSSVFVAGIGILSYLAPLPGILLAYQFSRTPANVVRLLKLYVVVSCVMLSGVYLSYWGYNWQVLKQVGEGLFIYSLELGRLDLHCGFFRSPEIAAWHGATAACLLVLLALSLRRSAILKWCAGPLVMIIVGALLLTGRRKALVEVFLFAAIYGLLLIWLNWTAIRSAFVSRSAVVLGISLVVGFIGYMYFTPEKPSLRTQSYYARGLSVEGDVGERFSNMTIGSFEYVIQRNGILGSGAGTGSQGSQYFGGGSEIVGSAAEGGLAKVLAELGVPGLSVLLWLMISIARYLWSIVSYIKYDASVDPALAKLVFGLIAFLTTNMFVYVIAHQVFGDPFVLILLGFFIGFAMAMPRMQQNIRQVRPLAVPTKHPAAAGWQGARS